MNAFLMSLLGTISAASIVALVAWFSREFIGALIRQVFSKDLEKFKGQLARELEEHKHALARQLALFAAHATGVTNRRLDALLNLYKALSRSRRSLGQIVQSLQLLPEDPAEAKAQDEVLRQKCVDAINSYQDLLFDNIPLFDERDVSLMHEVRGQLRKTWRDHCRK